MSNVKSAYGPNNQAITCTLASLGTGGARSSLAIDNTSNLWLDALVQIKIKTGASGAGAQSFVNIYAYGTVDGGTTYPEGTGTDVGITLTSPTNLRLIGVINTPTNATTFISEPMSVAAAFGGLLPDHWGIVIENQTNTTLDGTEASHAKLYQGTFATVV